jgi:peptidoglycan/LPS O-acetylase OafA/YrhL
VARTLGDVAGGRENNLTFIRFVAACMVIYGHSYAVTTQGGGDLVAQITGYAFAGGVAVDLFFLISGYLVCASIRSSGLVSYVVARILRIYPALIINMVLVVFVLGTAITTLPTLDYLTHAETWSYFIGLVTTVKLAFFLPGVFDGNTNTAANGSIWSILVEVRLYVVVALFYVFGLLRSVTAFNLVYFLGIVLLWKFPEWLPDFAQDRTGSHVCFLFVTGVFLQMNREHIPLGPLPVLFALVLCAITVLTPTFEYAYSLLIITLFLAMSFGRQFAWMDRYGDFSYGIYLYGWPVQQLVVYVFPGISALADAAISILLCIGIGFLSWHLVEKRALAQRHVVVDRLRGIGRRMRQRFMPSRAVPADPPSV